MHFSSVLVAAALLSITSEAGPLPTTESESSLAKSGSTESVSTKETQAHASSTLITKVTSSSLHQASSATSTEDWLDSIWNEAFGQQTGSIHTSQVKASATSSSSKEDPTSNGKTFQGSETTHAKATSTSAKSTTSTSKPVITTAPKTTQTAGLIGYPCTSVNTQISAVTAFESCTTWSGGVQAMFSGKSTQVQSGISMQVTLVSTASAYVGTLTDWNLYTSISAALMTACSPSGLPSSATKTSGQTSVPSWTTCADVADVTGIVYSTGRAANMNQVQDYGGHDWYSDGKLKISVPEVSFTDKQSLTAMVAGLASSLNSSSMNWKNYQTTVGPYCDGDVCNSADYWAGPNCVKYDGMDAYGRNLPPVKPYPPDVVTVPGFLQSIMTVDTLKAPDWPVQFLSISLSTEEAEAGEFTCADGALITDGLGVLAFVPGLGFLAWMAWPALAVSATCAGTEKAEH